MIYWGSEYIKHLASKNIEELEEKLEELKLQDYINSCSDDFYYSNGGQAAMNKKIAEVNEQIKLLKELMI